MANCAFTADYDFPSILVVDDEEEEEEEKEEGAKMFLKIPKIQICIS